MEKKNKPLTLVVPPIPTTAPMVCPAVSVAVCVVSLQLLDVPAPVSPPGVVQLTAVAAPSIYTVKVPLVTASVVLSVGFVSFPRDDRLCNLPPSGFPGATR